MGRKAYWLLLAAVIALASATLLELVSFEEHQQGHQHFASLPRGHVVEAAVPAGSIPLLEQSPVAEPRHIVEAPGREERLMVSVVTEGQPQRAVSGAQLQLAAKKTLWFLGRTDEDGQRVVRVEPDPSALILCNADGYAPQSKPIPDRVEDGLSIALAPQGHVEGRVVGIDGQPAAGIHVLAHLTGCDAGVPEDTGLRPRTFFQRGIVSRSDGSFAIGGLHPRASYTVVAASKGFLSQPQEHVRPGADAIEVMIQPLYGAILRFREPDGTRPKAHRDLTANGPIIGGFRKLGGRYVSPKRGDLQFAGVAKDLLATQSRDDWVMLWTIPRDQESAGAIPFYAELPGYVPVEGSLHIPRVEDAVAEYVITVSPLSERFGSARFNLTEAVAQSGTLAVPMVTVVLQARGDVYQGRSRRLTLAMHALPQTGALIEGIPAGWYRVSIEAHHGLWRTVGWSGNGHQDIEISDRETDVLFSTDDAGAVRVQVHEMAGDEYAGAAVLELSPTYANGAPVQIPFERGPFVVPLLPPGTYEVSVRWPLSQPQHMNPASIVVEPRLTTKVVISGRWLESDD